MISQRDLTNLPIDPTAAFVKIEEKIRDELNSDLINNDISNQLAHSRYMNGTIAASKSLGLNLLK